jgi:hypothetical protein
MMRKAQSAADFRSYDGPYDGSGGGGTGSGGGGGFAVSGGGGPHSFARSSRGRLPDLGLLTPFYSVETGTFVPDHHDASAPAPNTNNNALYNQPPQQPRSGSGSLGGSLNASSGSLNTLRASASHAVLSSYGAAALAQPQGLVAPASSSGSASMANMHQHHAAALRHAHSGSGLSALPSSTALSSLVSFSSAGHSRSSAALAAAAAAAAAAASKDTAPLVAHFSLSGLPKSNGQPRAERSELAMLTEKLREMQYEVSRLHRKLRERDQDAEQWSVRYARRAVLACQALLACTAFLMQFGEGLRRRRVDNTALHRLFIPSNVYEQAAAAAGSAAKAAAKAAKAAAGGPSGAAAVAAAAAKAAALRRSHTPLSAVLLSGCLTGLVSALPFALSFALQLRNQAAPRNIASLLSVAYSIGLLLLSRRASSSPSSSSSSSMPLAHARPPLAHVVNVAANTAYVAARYYFLHGLLVFNSMRML